MFSFSSDSCDVVYGNNSFKGNLQNYTIKIDPDDFDGIGINLNLKSTLKPYRPQDGIIKAGDDYFAWLSAVPNGVVSGDLIVNGKKPGCQEVDIMITIGAIRLYNICLIIGCGLEEKLKIRPL